MVYFSPIASHSSNIINEIHSTKNKFAKWVQIWKTQIKVFVDIGFAPQKAYDEICRVVVDDLLVSKFKEYERITHHDINAGIKYLSELCPTAAQYIHAGFTSMDVDDNGRVLQQREALEYIIHKISGTGLDVGLFNPKGKLVSGAIGTSSDSIELFGSVEKALEFSKKIMNNLEMPYFVINSQIYRREQDAELSDYLISIADKIRNKCDNKTVDNLYSLMLARNTALFINGADDICHRTIADSVVRRIEIPELFMLLDGIINAYLCEPVPSGKWVNPLSRYASNEFTESIADLSKVKDSFKKGLVNAVYNMADKIKEPVLTEEQKELSAEEQKITFDELETIKGFRDAPYLARTHLQPAQITTVGRYFSITLDKLIDYVGCIDNLESVLEYSGFISSLGQTLSNFSNTLVFRQALRQWSEPFKSSQVGSSAMPYKTNPNKSERIKGLARMIPGRLTSVREKHSLSDYDFNELLLIADSILSSFNYIMSSEGGIRIDRKRMLKEIDEYKSEIFQTELLQEAVKLGAVREKAHNELRDIKIEGTGLEGIKSSKYFNRLFGNKLDDMIDESITKSPLEMAGTSLIDADNVLINAQKIIDENRELLGSESKINV